MIPFPWSEIRIIGLLSLLCAVSCAPPLQKGGEAVTQELSFNDQVEQIFTVIDADPVHAKARMMAGFALPLSSLNARLLATASNTAFAVGDRMVTGLRDQIMAHATDLEAFAAANPTMAHFASKQGMSLELPTKAEFLAAMEVVAQSSFAPLPVARPTTVPNAKREAMALLEVPSRELYDQCQHLLDANVKLGKVSLAVVQHAGQGALPTMTNLRIEQLGCLSALDISTSVTLCAPVVVQYQRANDNLNSLLNAPT